jgi:hypothetical protein
MHALPVHALPSVPEMHELPVHAPPSVPEMHELPVHAPPSVPEMHELPVYRCPRPLTSAPPTANPAADTPHPPTGYLGIVVRRIAFKACGEFSARGDQPDMPRVQIVLVHRPICIPSHLLGIRLNRPPEIRDEPVPVIDGFNSREWLRPPQ